MRNMVVGCIAASPTFVTHGVVKIALSSVPLGYLQFQQRHGLQHRGIAFALSCRSQNAFGDALDMGGVDGCGSVETAPSSACFITEIVSGGNAAWEKFFMVAPGSSG